MTRKTDTLTEAKINAVFFSGKQTKLFDGEGLYLLVTMTGSKLWRFKYRLNGKEKLISLGSYPKVGLDEARQLRGVVRGMVIEGIDPSEVRKKEKSEHKKVAKISKHLPSVKIVLGGKVEIKRGRSALRLTSEEADFVCDLLNKLR